MTDLCIGDRLLDEVQEEYDFDHVLPLYLFAWSLVGLGMDRSDSAFTNLCRSAFTTFVERHPDLVLVWVNWPIDIGTARAAEAGTSIELDADPEAPTDTPLLALVAPDLLPT